MRQPNGESIRFRGRVGNYVYHTDIWTREQVPYVYCVDEYKVKVTEENFNEIVFLNTETAEDNEILVVGLQSLVKNLEKENEELRKTVKELRQTVKSLCGVR